MNKSFLVLFFKKELLPCLLALATTQAVASSPFAGSQACASCHAKQAQAWQHSHHALANITDPTQFLGKFAPAPVRDGTVGITWHQGTPGLTATVDGITAPVHAALGVYPLQQYIADMPGGRRQVLPLAWDARPASQGGQRWFNPARANGPAWTSLDQTWNFMCVDCHATGVAKNYDLAANAYNTTMEEPGVACESCHGAGAAHVAWARAGANPAQGPALSVALTAATGHWSDFDPVTGIRHWTGPPRPPTELAVCAPCHSRRRKLVDQPAPGGAFLDNYEPSLLTSGLYQADGQILDEDFEYGSFLQSRMFQNGVVCTDCHDAHTGKTRIADNGLCAQCHDAAKFDTAAHHHHTVGSAESRCVACHMPTRTYMGVHVRHDHGMRIPRPDISVVAGTSNACTDCHTDRGASWAADVVRAWRGNAPAPRPGAADALAAARQGSFQAAAPSLPPIVRATMVAEGADPHGAATDADPLVRMAAAAALDDTAALTRLVADPVLAVRITAARHLPNAPEAAAALNAWRAAEAAASDRPESHLNLGALLADQGKPSQAAEEFRTALRLDSDFAPALIDLADLSRAAGREPEAERLLRQAVSADPANAEAWYALTLALIRQHRLPEAAEAISHAVRLNPADASYRRIQTLLSEPDQP